MIGLCTDSNAQLPPELVARYGVEVVPLTVVVDGRAYLEGVELHADAFYARFADGAVPDVATAAPSPGQFAAAYEALAARGATSILSIHIGSSLSATLNAARLAADAAPAAVRLVDTGTASFAVGCCVWEAGEALAAGRSADEAAAAAEGVAGRVTNVFVVGALDLVRRGGRLAAGVVAPSGTTPVLSLVEGAVRPVGEAATAAQAADLMADHVLAAGSGLRVGISIADAEAEPLWQALEDRLAAAPQVVDMVRYRVGPSVGVHTGPGTAGAVAYPASPTAPPTPPG